MASSSPVVDLNIEYVRKAGDNLVLATQQLTILENYSVSVIVYTKRLSLTSSICWLAMMEIALKHFVVRKGK